MKFGSLKGQKEKEKGGLTVCEAKSKSWAITQMTALLSSASKPISKHENKRSRKIYTSTCASSMGHSATDSGQDQAPTDRRARASKRNRC